MSHLPGWESRPHGYVRQLSNDSRPSLPDRMPTRDINMDQTVRATRRQTVRGPVRGTVVEAGTNPRLSMAPTRGLTRGKTLTRPDRFVAPAPLINPQLATGPQSSGANVHTALINGVPTLTTSTPWWDPWTMFVTVSTFWAPRWLLRRCGIRDPAKQRAWKEKCALCSISVILMAVIGYITLGLNRTLCPADAQTRFARLGEASGSVGIEGWNVQTSSSTPAALLGAGNTLGGTDVTYLFDRSAVRFPACNGIDAAFATSNMCAGPTGNTANATCPFQRPTIGYLSTLGMRNTGKQVGYSWEQLSNLTNYLVIDGNVLNLNPYMLAHPTPITNDTVDSAVRFMLKEFDERGGRDATRIFYNRHDLQDSVPCLVQRYYAGHLDKITPGCFVSHLFLYVSLGLIMSIILVRFFMACIFSWYLSAKLVQAPKNLRRAVISPAVMPEGANIDIGNTTGAAPWTNQEVQRRATQRLRRGAKPAKLEKEMSEKSKHRPDAVGQGGMISMASIGAELFCVCLVTCYSEGAESIKTTLDSIAGTSYSDARKLLFVVCDGMITGDGESMSTPDICVNMLEADPRFGEPQAMSYVSIGHGSKEHNMALVYAGHYTGAAGHRTPTIIVVKCGTPEEAQDKKPGNRGKRDSQMILMNFFSRVTYNDRMTPLDFDLFRKTQSLMGVTPDFFEVCLMVDADTKVYPQSLGYLVRTMQNDNMIMGVCGETRIANKRQSWVTMIQVFEYFISHHLAKSFESVFGGVTCLPGCFSMYRLKARKQDDGDWFPVLVQPQVISEYSQSVVTTLHQKNLLLLGEDRFLTTLLLRTFPNRKMMFCPYARCRTVVPHTFGVLLSQRRRWINSTIHNLMELVRVRSLCGSFCFSMQFVVFVDLIGTVTLPIAICLTLVMLITYIFSPPSSFSDAIPLILLAGVLGLPGVLILISTFKVVYVGWMLVYLLALPIWNFILPVYAFSKFDDFSWGETRKVAGEIKGEDGHGSLGGVSAKVPLRRWEDWERSRLRKIKREERRRREFERQFGTRETHSSYTMDDSLAPSETASSYGGDEDRWGMEIGQYNEDVPSTLPPPVGLFNVDSSSSSEAGDHDTIEAHELELVLDQGWTEDDVPTPTYGGEFAFDRTTTPLSGQATLMEHSWSNRSQDPLNPFLGGHAEEHFYDPGLSDQQQPPTSAVHELHGFGPSRAASSGVASSFSHNHTKRRSLSSTHSTSPVLGRRTDHSEDERLSPSASPTMQRRLA
ncbi:hypothetical protein OIV83_003197 [Microbotryomycetes sp. JL201]|nr:hypothetical protein OIV83_003197 [Microbotryomycetes sp. JL201]